MAPSHYLNQCWNIINWTLRSKFQWILNHNSYIFIQDGRNKMAAIFQMTFLNVFKNVIWEMAAILSRPQYVKIKGTTSHWAEFSRTFSHWLYRWVMLSLTWPQICYYIHCKICNSTMEIIECFSTHSWVLESSCGQWIIPLCEQEQYCGCWCYGSVWLCHQQTWYGLPSLMGNFNKTECKMQINIYDYL